MTQQGLWPALSILCARARDRWSHRCYRSEPDGRKDSAWAALARRPLVTAILAARGDFVTSQISLQIPGISYDGGYAEYMTAPTSTFALIPDGLSAVDAALLMAGVTTFNSLRHSGAQPGDLVAALGIGGSAIWEFSS